MTKYYVTVDQISVNFPIDKSSGLNTALSISRELHFSDILGGSEKSAALNHYSEAISFYDNKIKLMWSTNRPKQGLLLYFSATGWRAWRQLGALEGYDFKLSKIIKFLVREKAKFTRIDVAIDVIDGNFTVEKIQEKLQKKEIVILDCLGRELSAKHQRFFGEKGLITGVTVGSRSSNNFLRIYDKKLEQSRKNAPFFDLAHQAKTWTRIEAEFKHNSAKAILPDLNKLSESDDNKINRKLVGYVVHQWTLAKKNKKAILVWQHLLKFSNGYGRIPPLEPKLTDRLVQVLTWFLSGGAGVFYRVAQLFGEVGKADFLLFLFDYVSKPGSRNHYSIPGNMAQDLKLIQAQHPNIKTINFYLKKAVSQIEEDKKASHSGSKQ